VSATTRSLRSSKLAIIGLVLLMLASAWYFGVFARIGEPSALAHMLVEMGAWGYLAFIIAYTALQPFGVPGTVFVVAAPLTSSSNLSQAFPEVQIASGWAGASS